MRPSSAAFLGEIEKHGDLRRAIVIFGLSNANGVRYFSRRPIPDAIIAASGSINFLDGSFTLDGGVKLGEGSEVHLGSHDWVLDGGFYNDGRFAGVSPLESFSLNELSGVSLTLSNETDADGHPRMTRLLSTEPILNARLDVRIGFDGQDVADVLLLKSFRVVRAEERKDAVTLGCEGA